MTQEEVDALPAEARARIRAVELEVGQLILDIGIKRTAELLEAMARNVWSARIG